MGRIIKTLAVAAGAGIATGICVTSRSRRAPQSDPIIDIEPLLDRLETMERRLDAAQDQQESMSANVQRLILAIEHLCERAPAPAPEPILLPFEAHLREAEQEIEAGTGQKKSRFPIARIFGMLALVALTQVLR